MVLNIQGNQTEPETTIGRFGLEKKDPTVGIKLPEGLIDDYFKNVQSSPDGSYPELPTKTSVLSLKDPDELKPVETSSSPSEIVVGPVYVLSPVNVSVPAPCFVNPPVPEATPEN